MQDIAFDFMHGNVVLEFADVLNAADLVCVDVIFGLGGEACGGVAWRFKMRERELILEEFLPAVNR